MRAEGAVSRLALASLTLVATFAACRIVANPRWCATDDECRDTTRELYDPALAQCHPLRHVCYEGCTKHDDCRDASRTWYDPTRPYCDRLSHDCVESAVTPDGGGEAGDGAPTDAGADHPLLGCGNDQREDQEVCDGTDLAGKTCQTEGFEKGTLACAKDCKSLVLTGCARRELFVLNRGGANVTVHLAAKGAPTAPLRTFGSFTGLSRPSGVAVNAADKQIFVANRDSDSVTVYNLADEKNVPPARVITVLPSTAAPYGLAAPGGLAFDEVHGELIVTGGKAETGYVMTFPKTASGSSAPTRSITWHTGVSAYLSQGRGVAVDPTHDEIFVVDGRTSLLATSTVIVYDRTAGDPQKGLLVDPKRTFGTQLTSARDIAYDPALDELFVAGDSGVNVFARTAPDGAAPKRQILLGGGSVEGLTLDASSSELILVGSWGAGAEVRVYPKSWAASNTAPAPARTLKGGPLQAPAAVAVSGSGSSRALFVADTGALQVLSAVATGIASPLRTLGTNDIVDPLGLALDAAHGEVFVASRPTNTVAVYARSASGPTAVPLRPLQPQAPLYLQDRGMAFDAKLRELFVSTSTSQDSSKGYAVFDASAKGATSALRRVAGGLTGLDDGLYALALAPGSDEAYAFGFFSLSVFPMSASGNLAPKRTLQRAGAVSPLAIAVSGQDDELCWAVTNDAVTPPVGSIQCFTRTAAGTDAPLRTISGSSTGLQVPSAIVIDEDAKLLFVADERTSQISVFKLKDTGNVTPQYMIAGTSTGLNRPIGLALSW